VARDFFVSEAAPFFARAVGSELFAVSFLSGAALLFLAEERDVRLDPFPAVDAGSGLVALA
jgi:hypothetical protein